MRPQPYAKSYRQLQKAGSARGGLPQRRAHQLVVQCQMVSPENIQKSNTTQTSQVIFWNTPVYANTYIDSVTTDGKKRP